MIPAELLKFFEVLGYGRGSYSPTREELKKRWRELCLKHHPDRGGDEEQFIQVMHAYQMITSPEYRHKQEMEAARKSNGNRYGDLNIRIQVPISFDMAFFGHTVVISYNRLEFDDDLKPVAGKTFDIVTEIVDIPPGSTGGYETEIVGGGHVHKGTYGKAIVVVTPMPHGRLSVQGPHVTSREAVPLDVLLKGGSAEIMTMYGMKSLRIPAGTKPGSTLAIKRCGVNQVGDHVVSVEALFPSKDDLRTNEAWAGLGVNWEEEDRPGKDEADLNEVFMRIKTLRPDLFSSTTGA